tara:strand:- start:2181 stop:2426 length:246 start_codon:yes stop_codon:yes gene_type:complete
MNSYKDAHRHRDIYIDPNLMLQPWNEDIINEIDNYDDWDPAEDEIYEEEVSAALSVLLKEDLIGVYWTEDNRFYLEDNTRR